MIKTLFFFILITILFVALKNIFEFNEYHAFLFFCIWPAALTFDLHSTFMKKELISREYNFILRFLLKKTSIRNTVVIFIPIEIGIILGWSFTSNWGIELIDTFMMFGFIGICHIIAGVSNRRLINKIYNTGKFL